MIRLLFWILLILLVGVGAAGVAGHPGNVVLNWDELRLETSIAVAALGPPHSGGAVALSAEE